MKKVVMIFMSLALVAPFSIAEQGIENVWKASTKEVGQAKYDRLSQDELQDACSTKGGVKEGYDVNVLRQKAQESIVYPKYETFDPSYYLGDWKNGESIAKNGKGLQYNDDPKDPNGGNCYACHQMAQEEVAYGTLGTTLQNYGMRGQSEVMMQYTWAKIYNPHVYNVCSMMPRFGVNGILTEQQMKDVMAYLLDPNSPVNN